MSLTDKQRANQIHITAAEAAGKSLALYAREHGLRVHVLYSEKQRQHVQSRKSLPGFVRIEDISAPTATPSLMQVRLPNGVSLAMPVGQVSLDLMLQTLAKL